MRYLSTMVLRLSDVLDEEAAAVACDRIVSWARAPWAHIDAVVLDLRECGPPTGGGVDGLRQIGPHLGERLGMAIVASPDLAERLHDLPVVPSMEAALGGLSSRSGTARLRSESANREQRLGPLPAIEQFKGMLRQDFGLDGDHAIEFLKRLSQDTNVRVRDLAGVLVGQLSGTATEETSRATMRTINELRDVLRGPQRAGTG